MLFWEIVGFTVPLLVFFAIVVFVFRAWVRLFPEACKLWLAFTPYGQQRGRRIR